MDDRFMADAQRAVANGGIAERFRLIYGDVTGRKENAPRHFCDDTVLYYK
jgi:hypothetical protein